MNKPTDNVFRGILQGAAMTCLFLPSLVFFVEGVRCAWTNQPVFAAVYITACGLCLRAVLKLTE